MLTDRLKRSYFRYVLKFTFKKPHSLFNCKQRAKRLQEVKQNVDYDIIHISERGDMKQINGIKLFGKVACVYTYSLQRHTFPRGKI